MPAPSLVTLTHRFKRTIHVGWEDPVLLPAGMLVMIFLVLRWLMFNGTALPAEAYHERLLIWEFAANLINTPVALALSGLLVLAVGVRWRKALKEWGAFDHSPALRAVVIASAAVIVWPTAFYAQNHYLNQSHLWDRGLLVTLFALLCWRPIFVLPFLIQFYVINWQFEVPFGQHSWAATDLPVNLLILFSSTFLASRYTSLRLGTSLLFCVLIFVASHYWPSGFGKLRLGWLFHDHVELLLPATYANGWMAILSVEQMESLTRLFASVRPLMKFFTLVVECGAILFLLHRRIVLFLLPAWVAFHIGVFLLSGICFWQWSVVNLCLLVVVWKTSIFGVPFFTLPRFLVSVCLIFLAPMWLRPQNLSWFDAPANYVYRFEATGESGQRYLLHPGYFAPYEYPFTESGFAGATHHPVLPIYWGATSRDIANALINSGTPEGFFALESERGKVRFRQDTLDLLEDYVRVFVQRRNQRLEQGASPAKLVAPLVLWTLRAENGYRGQEQIRRIDVSQVVSFFDGEKYSEIRSTLLTSIEIP